MQNILYKIIKKVNNVNKKLVALISLVLVIVFMFTTNLNAWPTILDESAYEAEKYEGIDNEVHRLLGKELKSASNNKKFMKETHKKISSALLPLVNTDYQTSFQSQEEVLRQFNETNWPNHRMMSNARDTSDSVFVYIHFKQGCDISVIKPYIEKIDDIDEENSYMAAWIKADNLDALAAMDEVGLIKPVMRPQVNRGLVTTLGDQIHRADLVRSDFGIDGTDIKIGVISDGVNSWTQAINSGDLPDNVTVLSDTIGGDEGTAMLEIIHDIAPGADLYFHDCGSNMIAFNSAIDALINAGCKIIVDDITWLNGALFEDGTIAQHINYVTSQYGVLYISAAGNYAQRHYQGNYYNDGYNYHDFSSGASNSKFIYIKLPPGGKVVAFLQWNDIINASYNDYDLYLRNCSNFATLTASGDDQTHTRQPIEAIFYTNNTGQTLDAFIDVHKYSGESKLLELYFITSGGASPYYNNLVASDSIHSHNGASSVISVGAVHASTPTTIAAYSSQGPVTITYPTNQVLSKPDICGVSGVSVTGAGGFPSPFYGTSASAPHVAAIAALLWSQSPSMTVADLKSILISGSIDLGSAGFDYIYGNGRADAKNSMLLINIPVTGVSLNKTSMELTVGGASETLTANVSPSTASNKSLNWESSDPSVVTVSDGIVTPVTEGTADITVNTVDGGKSDSCAVTVCGPDLAPPAYQRAVISTDRKTVNVVFNENLVNNTVSEALLKEAVTFAADGTNFIALNTNDSLAINGNHLVITFAQPLVGDHNQIKIRGNTLKDSNNNVITADINTGNITEACFIATAAFGSYLDPHVWVLRQFRDNVLQQYSWGRWFVSQYYLYSPPAAAVIAAHPSLKLATRMLLTPLILAIQYPIASSTLILVFALVCFVRHRISGARHLNYSIYLKKSR
jgi:hypothetical protein